MNRIARTTFATLLAVVALAAAACSEPVDDRTVAFDENRAPTTAGVTGKVFDQATATALAGELAAAVDGTDWCIGWDVTIDDVGNVTEEFGSNGGVGMPATLCPNWVVVAADIRWVSSSSESNDSAGIHVYSSDQAVTNRLIDVHDVLDGAGSAAVAGDDGDTAIANAVSAVALALAADGVLDPIAVTATKTDEGVAFDDAGGEGGNDAFAQNRGTLLAGAALLLVGLGLLGAWALRGRRTDSGRKPGGSSGNPRAAMRAALVAAGGSGPPPPPSPSAGPLSSAPPPPPPPPRSEEGRP